MKNDPLAISELSELHDGVARARLQLANRPKPFKPYFKIRVNPIHHGHTLSQDLGPWSRLPLRSVVRRAHRAGGECVIAASSCSGCSSEAENVGGAARRRDQWSAERTEPEANV